MVRTAEDIADLFEAIKGNERDWQYNKPRLIEVIKEYASQPKWISVDDSLPNNGERILCYRTESNITTESIEIISYGSVGKGLPSGVTHWQPLPTSPTK